jgi:hypothetical protein
MRGTRSYRLVRRRFPLAETGETRPRTSIPYTTASQQEYDGTKLGTHETTFLVATSHNLVVASAEDVTIFFESGENAAE